MTIQGNTILITGGTSGIGLAIAQEFAARDNTVIIIGRNAAKLQEAASMQRNIIPFRCDIAQKEERERLFSFIQAEFPQINILINNAGIQHQYTIADEAMSEYIEQEIRINLTAPIELCSLFLPILLTQKSAAIVNVSSGLGFVPKKSAPVYCATKAALHIFTKSLRYQLEGTNIRVMELIPPLVDTPMTAGRGSGKISTKKLTMEFLSAFQKNRTEINIGKVKFLRGLQRIAPTLADNLLKNA